MRLYRYLSAILYAFCCFYIIGVSFQDAPVISLPIALTMIGIFINLIIVITITILTTTPNEKEINSSNLRDHCDAPDYSAGDSISETTSTQTP